VSTVAVRRLRQIDSMRIQLASPVYV
jgi:hypothetical protein